MVKRAREQGINPPRRRRGLASLRGVTQLWVLALASLLAVAVLVGATLTQLSGVQSDQARVLERMVPPAEALSQAQSKFAIATADFAKIVNATDRTDLVNQLAVFSDAAIVAAAAWNNYTRYPTRFPAEKALRTSVDTLSAERTKLLTQILLITPGQAKTEVSAAVDVTSKQAAAVATLRDHFESQIHSAVRSGSMRSDTVVTVVTITGGGALVVLITLFWAALHVARARERAAKKTQVQGAARAHRDELEARFQRALELARSEEETYSRIDQVLRESVPGAPLELLVADSSRAHFHQVVSTDPDRPEPGCAVSAPPDCPAASRGQTQVFASSAALDACSYLHDRPGGACSAICVPVGIAGKTVGVIHATGPDRKPYEHNVIATVELIARKAGERIGMLRAFTRSETQARTDQLSGLLNRRSLETQIIDLTNENRAYVVAYGDLDHFKLLNDVHGHDTGDRALRLFARILRDNVRPSDIPARYGGEEFVVVLPDCNVTDAVRVITRVQERLSAALVAGAVPLFTASFGVAATEGDWTFSETLERADQALLEAKRTGRDRIVVHGEDTTDPDAGNTQLSVLDIVVDSPVAPSHAA